MAASKARPAGRRARNQHGPHLFERDGCWYLYHPRRRGGIALGTTDRAEAERRMSGALRDLEAERPVDLERPREATLIACATAWLDAPHGYTRRTLETHTERARAIGTWLDEHGVRFPSEITPATVDTWVTERSRTVSRTTINRDLRTMRVFLRWAAARGLCMPVTALDGRDLREATRDRGRVVPSPEEMGRVLDAVPAAGVRTALTVLYATGLRCDELRRLAVGDVHDGALHVRPEAGPADTAEPGKGYRERRIPLSPEVVAEVTWPWSTIDDPRAWGHHGAMGQAPSDPLTFGVDVSSYERGHSLSAAAAAGDAFVIAKATQGIRYTDSTFAGFIADGRASGMLLGSYHFGDGSAPIAQADHYLAVSGAAGDDILRCLDWESNPGSGGTMTLEQARTFVRHVFEVTGVWPMLYSGAARLRQITDPNDVLHNCPWWVAEYGGFPDQEWTLFQYTDGTYGPSDQARFPRTTAGFGRIDRSVYQGDRAALTSWWQSAIAGSGPAPDPTGGGTPTAAGGLSTGGAVAIAACVAVALLALAKATDQF